MGRTLAAAHGAVRRLGAPHSSHSGSLFHWSPEWRDALVIALVVGLAWGLSQYLTARPSRRRRVDEGGHLRMVVGPMGAGKTYFCVYEALWLLRRGGRIAVNFELDFSGPLPRKFRCLRGKTFARAGEAGSGSADILYIEGWGDYLECENRRVIIDEFHVLAPSHDPQSVPDVVRFRATHSRKLNVDDWVVTQDVRRISTIYVGLATERVEVRARWMPLAGGRYFVARGYADLEPAKRGKDGRREAAWETRVPFKLWVCKCYSTRRLQPAVERMHGADAAVTRELCRRFTEGEALEGLVASVRRDLVGRELVVRRGLHVPRPVFDGNDPVPGRAEFERAVAEDYGDEGFVGWSADGG